MANELQTKLDAILLDKNTNLLPKHLKTGVTCLGVEGDLGFETTAKKAFDGTQPTIHGAISDTVFENLKLWGKSIQDDVPTVNTPVDIQNVTGDIKINITAKNYFDTTQEYISSNVDLGLWTVTQIENGLRVQCNRDGGVPVINYLITDLTNYVGQTIRLTADYVASSTNTGKCCIGICDSTGGNRTSLVNVMTSGDEVAYYVDSVITGKEYLYIGFYSNGSGTSIQSPDAYVDYTNIKLTIGGQDQEVVFPLGTQILSDASYIDNDGIHIYEKQQILTGNEEIKNYKTDTSTGFCGFTLIGTYTHIPENGYSSVGYNKCNYFPNNDRPYHNSAEGMWFPNANTTIYFTVPISVLADYSTNSAQVTSVKSWLADLYTAGNPVIIQVRLPEEELVPFTAVQQEAWDKIKHLTTCMNETTLVITGECNPTISGEYYIDVPAKLPIKLKNINGTVQVDVKAKNKFNGTLKIGLVAASDGFTYGENTDYVCSEDFIDVTGLTEVTLSNKGGLYGANYILQYDADKNYLGYQNAAGTSFSCTLVENTKYIRVELGYNNPAPTIETLGDFQIEEGTEATEYEAFAGIEMSNGQTGTIALTEIQSIILTSSTEGKIIQATNLTVIPSAEKQTFDDLYSNVIVEAVNYEEVGTITPEEYTEAQTQINDLFGEEETE